MHQQWWLHCTSQWGQYIPLSERVYCVTVTFRMTEPVEQWICIRFCMKLEHSSVDTIQMTQKAAATGSWWLAASGRQHNCSRSTSHAEFFGETSNHPGDSAPLQPRFGALWLLALSETKITFEREEILDCWWDSGRYDGAADGAWENCVRSQGAYFEGDWGVIVLCTVFLVSYILFNNCLYFSHYIAGYFHDRPCIPDVVLMLERWWNSVYFIV